MKLVRFTRSCAPYSAGETAAFDDATAMKYIAKGVGDDATPGPPVSEGEAPQRAARGRASAADGGQAEKA